MEVALNEIGAIVQGEYLQHRLQNLISTRMRGVRNKFQVLDVLKRPEKVGGLNLPDVEAERVANIIDKYFQDFHERVTDSEKQKITEVQETQKTKIAERKLKDAEEHEAWYQAQVSRTKAGTPKAIFKSVQDQAKQARPGTHSEMQEKRIQMQDIKPPVMLSGLAEELGNMNLEQFRRLSDNPNQATKQILQKLSTLQQESFESWTEGISAWRNSPMQRMYLTLVAESFTKGRTVTELVEEKKGSNGEMPTAEEIGAIIELNSNIHLS